MKTATGDLFHFPADALCITTNGFVKNNGEAVMGRGCALQATQRIPELPALLGKSLLAHGTHVIALGQHMGKELVSFPVKPAAGIPETQHDIDTLVVRHWQHKVRIGQRVPGFACTAVPELIERSAYELVEMANKQY